ncbi:hypothetical protein DFH28DRAFT_921443 [Melampsora americana]|nr:hypothetical protein DFH28DRAFT_921443 [Melampsora americana]
MALPSHHNTLKRDIQSISPQRLKPRALTPEALRAATVSAIEPMNLAGDEGKLSYLATGFNKPIEGSSKLSVLPFADRAKPMKTRIMDQIPTSISVEKFHSTGSFWASQLTSMDRKQRAYRLLVSQALASH